MATRKHSAREGAEESTEIEHQAEETTRFQTDLEQQHMTPRCRDDAPALLINPAANQAVLIASAQARMQALSGSLSAWLCTSDTYAKLEEVLRPLDHLAQEVVHLLEAAAGLAGQEVDHV